MAQQQVLREYLLSLGFRIDETQGKKFDTAIGGFDFNVGKLAKRLLAAGAAAQVMVGLFARSMEKLYYASQRTNTTAENIQALDYAATQVGVSADSMRSSLEGMARSLRSNPGLVDFLRDLKVPVEGRQTSDMLVDLVEQLGKMPFYQASQIGSMFGINPDDLLLMIKAGDKLRESMEIRRKMGRDAGLDMEQATAAGLEYAKMLSEITARLGILKDTAMVGLLPFFKQFAGVVNEVLKDWTKILKTFDSPGEFAKRLIEGIVGKAGGARVTLSKDSRDRIAAGALGVQPTPQSLAAPSGAPASLFSRLEQQFGLPAGLLDRMWAQESGRGKYMLSPAGAKGHFGFMDPTAKEMGLKDPNDLTSAASAAAEYMSRLMKKYGGNLQSALAAYNWGMGNVDRKGLGAAPWETQQYVKSISGQPIQATQINHFHIKSTDPEAVARETARAVDTTWSDITRNAPGGNIQ